jgi:hypothetical protein
MYQKTASSRKGPNRENTLIEASTMCGPNLYISFVKVLSSHSMLYNSWPIRRWALIIVTWVRFQASPYGIFGVPSGNRAGFCPRRSIFPCVIPPLFHTLLYLHLTDHIILAIGNVAQQSTSLSRPLSQSHRPDLSIKSFLGGCRCVPAASIPLDCSVRALGVLLTRVSFEI